MRQFRHQESGLPRHPQINVDNSGSKLKIIMTYKEPSLSWLRNCVVLAHRTGGNHWSKSKNFKQFHFFWWSFLFWWSLCQNGKLIWKLIWYQTDRFQNIEQFSIVLNHRWTDPGDWLTTGRRLYNSEGDCITIGITTYDATQNIDQSPGSV